MPDFVESQVEISANITPCVLTRVTDAGTEFTDGDMIGVQNINRTTKNLATYTYSESTDKWNTTDDLYWGVQPTNTFNAWYPATSAYNSFTIPTDQTAGTATADWMTATTTANRADGVVNLSFNHNLAKVTITIDKWSNEYLESEKVISSLELSSLSGVMSYNNSTLSGDNKAKWVKTYTKDANKSFVAIIAPGTYASATNIMQVYVKGSETPLAVKTRSDLTVEAGKAYSFKLDIGKDLAIITSSVTVGDWGDVDLEDNKAQQQ
jgi:phage anti-repressor protein